MSTEPRALSPELLDAFEQALRQVGAPVAESWRPGASASAIDELEAQVQGALSDEARLWWSWHDGVNDQQDFRPQFTVGSFWTPLSTQGSAARLPWLRETYAEAYGGVPAARWDNSWAVLCASQDAHIGIACDEVAKPLSPILYYDPDVNEHPQRPLLPSIGELVHLWLEALDDGTYTVTERGFEIGSPAAVEERWTAKGRPEAVHLL